MNPPQKKYSSSLSIAILKVQLRLIPKKWDVMMLVYTTHFCHFWQVLGDALSWDLPHSSFLYDHPIVICMIVGIYIYEIIWICVCVCGLICEWSLGCNQWCSIHTDIDASVWCVARATGPDSSGSSNCWSSVPWATRPWGLCGSSSGKGTGKPWFLWQIP